jgi:hypothetical protein
VNSAVCTVPRRGCVSTCEHSKAPAVIWVLARRTEPASGLRHLQHLASGWPTALGLVVGWSTAARRRPLVSQAAQRQSRDRSRPDRPQRKAYSKRAKQSSKPWHGALWLNALPSPSGTYHAAPKLAHAMVRGKEELEHSKAKKQREGCGSVGGCVCCPAFAQVSVVFSAGLNPRRRTPQPGRASPGSPDMLQRGVVRVALRLRRLSQVERQCVGVQTVQKRLRRG